MSTSNHVLKLEFDLHWIAIAGGGHIGLEFSEVTFIEVLDQLMPGFDLENIGEKRNRPRRRKKEG